MIRFQQNCDVFPSEFALASPRTVLPSGIEPATVVVRAGRIAEVRPGLSDAGVPTYALGDAALLPAFTDVHVHINEPGRTPWEGFATATASAAAAGITTLVDMPLNCSPVSTTAAALRAKVAAAEGKCAVRVLWWAGLVSGNAAELPALIDAGAIGAKAFMCHSGLDEFPAAAEPDLRAGMRLLAKAGLPLLAHAEIVSGDSPEWKNPRSHAEWSASRPHEFELDAIAMLIRLCRETGCRTHVVHLATARALPMLAAARAEGLPLTVETCPHYLHFDGDRVPDGETKYKCAPPLRGAANREGLWQGLRDGTIDLIASDHSPCPPELKALDTGDFSKAWGGICGLQLGPSVVWTGAKRRGLGLADLARWMSAKPAELAGVAHDRGAIAPGMAADLVAFDPESGCVVDPARLFHRHKTTPYSAEPLNGIVRGAWMDGKLLRPRSN